MNEHSASLQVLVDPLLAEADRQDREYGLFTGPRVAAARLAIAVLGDEVAEARDAWAAERAEPVWEMTLTEIMQVAAVALRAYRDLSRQAPAGHRFDPDWTVAPAATLRDLMRERGLDAVDLANAAHGPGAVSSDASPADLLAVIESVLRREPYGWGTAAVLAAATGTTASFWLGHEDRYRADLAAGRADTTPED